MKALLQHPRFQRHWSQVWRFALSGGIGATIDLGSLAFFIRVLGMDSRLAAIPSTLLAVLFVFLANKFFTFRNRSRNYSGQLLKFVLVYGVAIVLNIGMTTFFIWLGERLFDSLLSTVQIALGAKSLAIGIGAVFNYIFSHRFIFKKTDAREEMLVV